MLPGLGLPAILSVAAVAPPDFSAAKQESCLNVSLYSLLFGVSLAIAFGPDSGVFFRVFSAVFPVWGLCLRACHNSVSKCFSTALC